MFGRSPFETLGYMLRALQTEVMMTIAEFFSWIGSLSVWWAVAWAVGGYLCLVALSVIAGFMRMARG